MKKIEYEKIIEILKPKETDLITESKKNFLTNITINFNDNYYVTIKGKIPLDLANILYQKYKNQNYGIRIIGKHPQSNPDDYFKEDENQDKYIEGYEIEKKEGLIIFLLELKNYYTKKNNLLELENKTINKIIALITSELIKESSLSISTYQWMSEDSINRTDFYETVGRTQIKTADQIFRKTIEEFDKTINPYASNLSIQELEKIETYLNNLDVNITLYNATGGIERPNCVTLNISDKKTNNHVAHYRNPDGFSYQLHYKIEEEQYLSIIHNYQTTHCKESDKGETIEIHYFGDDLTKNFNIKYNITKNLIQTNFKETKKITEEQKKFILEELKKAIEYAQTITINNMIKQDSFAQAINNKTKKKIKH